LAAISSDNLNVGGAEPYFRNTAYRGGDSKRKAVIPAKGESKLTQKHENQAAYCRQMLLFCRLCEIAPVTRNQGLEKGGKL